MIVEEEGFTPQRVVGLVMQLLREIREHRLRLEDVEMMSDDLLGQGYTESEINAAFSWVYSRLDGMDPADILYHTRSEDSSFRVLHPAENAVLKPDGFGQLLEMHSLGLITLEDMEKIIERAMSFGGPLGAEEIRLMLHQFFFEEDTRFGIGQQMAFPGGSSTIH